MYKRFLRKIIHDSVETVSSTWFSFHIVDRTRCVVVVSRMKARSFEGNSAREVSDKVCWWGGWRESVVRRNTVTEMRVDDDLDEATGVRVDFQRDLGAEFKFVSLGDSRTKAGDCTPRWSVDRWASWLIEWEIGTTKGSWRRYAWYRGIPAPMERRQWRPRRARCFPVHPASDMVSEHSDINNGPRSITLSRSNRRYFQHFQEFSMLIGHAISAKDTCLCIYRSSSK